MDGYFKLFIKHNGQFQEANIVKGKKSLNDAFSQLISSAAANIVLENILNNLFLKETLTEKFNNALINNGKIKGFSTKLDTSDINLSVLLEEYQILYSREEIVIYMTLKGTLKDSKTDKVIWVDRSSNNIKLDLEIDPQGANNKPKSVYKVPEVKILSEFTKATNILSGYLLNVLINDLESYKKTNP
jgi:hypothetical protein